MEYKQSLRDKIAKKLVPVMKCLNDKKVELAGSTGYIMRLTIKAPQKETLTDWMDSGTDALGDYEEFLETEIFGNVIINYPIANSELFQMTNDSLTEVKSEVGAIDLLEFLPITMRVPFPDHHGFSDKNTEIKPGDIIIDIFWNEYNNPIPVYLKVTRTRGSFFQKRLASKFYELTLYRGELPLEIKQKAEEFLEFVSVESKKHNNGC